MFLRPCYVMLIVFSSFFVSTMTFAGRLIFLRSYPTLPTRTRRRSLEYPRLMVAYLHLQHLHLPTSLPLAHLARLMPF
jgi:hypothetical protein